MTTLKSAVIGFAALVMTSASLGSVAIGFATPAFAGDEKANAQVWKGEEIVVEAPRLDKDAVIVEAPRVKQKKGEETKVATKTENRSSVSASIPRI